MTAASLPPMATTRRSRAKRVLCWVVAISMYLAGSALLTAAAVLGGFR